MKQSLTPALARVFKLLHYPFDVMLMCVRWCIAYGLSVRNLEEMMAERGIEVDHSTVHRWAVRWIGASVFRQTVPRVFVRSVGDAGQPKHRKKTENRYHGSDFRPHHDTILPAYRLPFRCP